VLFCTATQYDIFHTDSDIMLTTEAEEEGEEEAVEVLEEEVLEAEEELESDNVEELGIVLKEASISEDIENKDGCGRHFLIMSKGCDCDLVIQG